MDRVLETLIREVEFAEAQRHGDLTVLPIISDHPAGPEYLSLSEALAAGVLTITEISEGGSVPELAVVNEGDLPVLILDGEELAGAKQNRVLNTTVLLKEHSKTIVPVSCVELGRWRYTSREFRDSGNVMAARLRARKHAAVTDNLVTSGHRMSNQGDVWAGVAEMALEAGVTSPTDAMRDVYSHIDDDLTALMRAFTPLPGQRGMAVFINGQVAGVDYVSQPRVFTRIFTRLLRSYAFDALLTKGQQAEASPEDARQFLAAMESADIQTYEAVGYGREHRVSGSAIVGSALTLDPAVIHLSLLPAKRATPGEGAQGRERIMIPFPRSYWVRPGQFLAGCYPGAARRGEAERKLRSLVDVGVRCIINLMEPDETDHYGRPFVPYAPVLQRYAAEAGIEVECLRLPVPDQCVPTREAMREILDCIDARLSADQPVYLHCWGGKGRTGTVVGCWLARHGIALGEDALRMVQSLRRHDLTARQPSPENDIQRHMVRTWRQGE